MNSVRTLYSYSSCNHVLLIFSRFRVPFYLAVYLTHVSLQQLPPAEAGSLSSAVVNAVRNLYSFIFPTITFKFFLLISPSSITALLCSLDIGLLLCHSRFLFGIKV